VARSNAQAAASMMLFSSSSTWVSKPRCHLPHLYAACASTRRDGGGVRFVAAP